MLNALALALAQLADPRVLRVLAKSMGVTLLVFAVLGAGLWWGLDAALTAAGLDDTRFAAPEGLRGLVALAIALVAGWLLWRVIALAVLQFFGDEVVMAVEARHYPAALANARRLGWHEELANGLRGAGRALLWNLLALPVAAVLLITGVGAPLVFWLVNSVLLGRELIELVWLRHAPAPRAPLPVGGLERAVLGGAITALLAVPFVNLLAPVLGAAAAAHLVHRKGNVPDAA